MDKSKYTLIDHTIIIHFNVDESINLNLFDEFFTQIIFSNYTNSEICISQQNKYHGHFHEYWNYSIFNSQLCLPNNLTHIIFGHKFNSYVILPDKLTHLIFGDNFNQPVNLPNELIYLIFGDEFNQSINLPDKLIHLYFGNNFNKPIKLTNNLTYLEFGYFFNQTLILTDNLTHLIFGHDYDQFIVLTNKLIYLELGHDFSQFIELSNVKSLNINCNCMHLINNLSNSLENIIFEYSFTLPLNNLPNTIKSIKFMNWNYKQELNNLPHSIEYIMLPSDYDKQILSIPAKLQSIELNKRYKFIENFIFCKINYLPWV